MLFCDVLGSPQAPAEFRSVSDREQRRNCGPAGQGRHVPPAHTSTAEQHGLTQRPLGHRRGAAAQRPQGDFPFKVKSHQVTCVGQIAVRGSCCHILDLVYTQLTKCYRTNP